MEKIVIVGGVAAGATAAAKVRRISPEAQITMPVFGHWLKQAWGLYTKWTKLGWFPKII